MENNLIKDDEKKPVIKFSLKFYIIMTVITTSVATLSQTFIFRFFFDENAALYNSGNSIGRLEGIMLFVFVLILSSSAMSIKNKFEAEGISLEPVLVLQRILAGISAAFVFYKSYICLSQMFLGSYINGKYFFVSTMDKSENIVTMVMLIVAIPTAVFLILIAFLNKEKSGIMKIFGFFPIVWCAFCLLKTYFDSELPINSPLKIFIQIIFVSFMLFFLSEQGVRIGKNRIKSYVVTASVSTLLGTTYSVSRIFARLTNEDCIYSSYSLSLLILSISLYAFSRMIYLLKKTNNLY